MSFFGYPLYRCILGTALHNKDTDSQHGAGVYMTGAVAWQANGYTIQLEYTLLAPQLIPYCMCAS